MLPAFIIDEIRKREQDRRRSEDRPRVELPVEPRRPPERPPGPAPEGESEDPPEEDRAVVIDFD